MVDVNGYPDIYKGCKIKVLQLAPGILAIAKQGYGGYDWGAYIGTDKLTQPTVGPDNMAKSKNLEECVGAILENGSKLEHSVAKMLFPTFEREYRWRP